MAPIPEKALAALNAMKAIGIPIQTSKPVLKSLLKVYDNNWEYIEAENYRVLADAILDMQETQANDKLKKKMPGDEQGILRKGKEVITDESEPLRTRARARKEDNHVPSSMVTSDISVELSQKKIPEDDISGKGKGVVSDEAEPLRTRARGRKEDYNLVSSKVTSDVAGESSRMKIPNEDISKKEKEVVNDEPEPLRTRVRSRKEDHNLPTSKGSIDVTSELPLKRPKLEQDVLPDVHDEQEIAGLVYSRSHIGKIVQPALPQSSLVEARMQNLPSPPSWGQNKMDGVLPQMSSSSQRYGQTLACMNGRKTRTMNQTDEAHRYQKDKQQKEINNSILLKKPIDEPGAHYQKENDTVNCSSGLVEPINEPCGFDSPITEIPLSMICPPQPPSPGDIAQDEQSKNENRNVPVNECEKGTTTEILPVRESSSFNVDIASSDLGEVKLSFCCSPDRPNFHVPNLEAVFKLVEDRCLNSYKILQPSFSLTDLMKEMCQCFLQLGSKTTDDDQENLVQITPMLDSLKKPITPGIHDVMPTSLKNFLGSTTPDSSHVRNAGGNDQNGTNREIEEAELPKSSESFGLAVVQQPKCSIGKFRPLHDVNDISKGEERVKIPLVNEITSDIYPPSFNYIPRNIVYQNAFVNFSLARIGDEDCCPDCFGNCLAATVPCPCARETGGEYAYTLDGLVRKEFLDECISTYCEPQTHHKFFCGDCPLERSKNEGSPEACKGHLVRKFIKECWSKCGCSMLCGNRVVQRGITRNLQVFLTSKEKGWGLRTLEELPRGAFVCEYVGEILTNTELYDRTMETTGNAKHTYPVLLDADWGSEGSLKDEEALCLDATFYGNVARFINHRCCDANMIEIPVEVETPDHHYYHLAFFTTRKVEASEELTWDYGIDFDDHDHPIKAFKCRCGSRLCRDTRRRKRSRPSK